MKLPEKKFLLPELKGDISNIIYDNNIYYRSARDFYIMSPDSKKLINLILSVKSTANSSVAIKQGERTNIYNVFADYTFIYLSEVNEVELLTQNTQAEQNEIQIRLCIGYYPPIMNGNVELLEQLKNLGRYRILTPKPSIARLIDESVINLKLSKTEAILPLGIRHDETPKDLIQNVSDDIEIQDNPVIIELESTGFCNLSCVHCPQGIDDGMPYPAKPVSLEIVENLKPALQAAKVIHLHGYGEPLASPQIWKIIDLVACDDVVCSFNTNGVLLNEKNINKILNSPNLVNVNISVDACTSETFYKIRGADFELVIKNIKNLLRLKKQQNKNFPHIMITMVLMQENLFELNGFIELAAELGGVSVAIWNIKSNNTFFGTKGFSTIDNWKINRDDWSFNYSEQLPHKHPKYEKVVSDAIELAKKLNVPVFGLSDWPSELFSVTTEMYKGLESKPSDCHYYKDSLYVSSNGDARMCCYQIGSPPIDNLQTKSFKSVWNGDKMNAVRSMLANDRIPLPCSKATCQYVKGY